MNDALLKKLYEDYKAPYGLGSSSKLYKEAKRINKKISHDEVKNFLKGNFVYTLHYPARRYWLRNRVIVSKPHEQAQMDLCDMTSLKNYNSGVNYLLTFIDCFSKFSIVKTLYTKSQQEVSSALDEILRNYYVEKLQSDRGKEFINSMVRKVAEKNGTYLFFTHNQDIKCSIVERFNRSLKSRMFKYFTMNGTRRYVDVLQKLVDAYNNSIHRSIRMAPSRVKMSDTSAIFKRLFPGFKNEHDLRSYIAQQDISKTKFKIGSLVRIKYYLNVMEHRFLPNYSDQIYRVTSIVKGYPRYRYRLSHLDKEEKLLRSFYEEELEEVRNNEYRIKVIDSRIRKGKKEYLIHFIGHDKSEDEWRSQSSIRELGA